MSHLLPYFRKLCRAGGTRVKFIFHPQLHQPFPNRKLLWLRPAMQEALDLVGE